MPTRPKFYLLDAGPVIELHRLGLWQEVLKRATLVLPGTVAGEADFYPDSEGAPRRIDLSSDIRAGRVQVKEAEAAQVAQTAQLFDVTMQEAVHLGELEALTLLRLWEGDPPLFSTSDRHAVIGLCLLGFSHLAMSLEAMLAQIGLTQTLSSRFSELTFTDWREIGKMRRLRGEGLAR
jgi:hypothetical protein